MFDIESLGDFLEISWRFHGLIIGSPEKTRKLFGYGSKLGTPIIGWLILN